MMKFLCLWVLCSFPLWAYVPTVESLFRNGANPDVTSNAVSLNFVVKRAQGIASANAVLHDVSNLRDLKENDFYRIVFHEGSGGALRLSQARFSAPGFSESTIEHKSHHPSFTALSIRPGAEHLEKGIFFGVLQSLALNDGLMLINYLKSLGVPVRSNSEILNRQKVELLASYKTYLAQISRDRSGKKIENPLRPENPEERERVDQIMNESIYADTHQVKLSRIDGEMVWLVNAGPFEALLSYRDRHLRRVSFKSPGGDFEILAVDYWMANGSHYLPRTLKIRSLSGENYQVELKNLRHFNEREDDLVKRINRWDQVLKGKMTTGSRPEFLL